MSASDLASVVEGWATLAGLIVVIVGAIFAGVQLRQEAKSRHLQAIMGVLSDIRPPEVFLAQQIISSIPDGFAWDDLSQEASTALLRVTMSYGRLGNLLAAGMVDGRDIFPHLVFSAGAIEFWEKVKHWARSDPRLAQSGLKLGMLVEFLAARAQDYLEREGVKQFGNLPIFDADPNFLDSIANRVEAARSAG